MDLQQLKEEAIEEFDNTFIDWNGIIYEGDYPVKDDRMKDFIDYLVAKAYEAGKKEAIEAISKENKWEFYENYWKGKLLK